MSLSDRETQELCTLCDAVVEQTINEEQSQHLARWLKESESARQFYVRYLGLAAGLHYYAGRLQSNPVVVPAAARTTRPGWGLRLWQGALRSRTGWFLVASMMLALTAGLWFALHPRETQGSPRPIVAALVGELEVESNGISRHLSSPIELSVGDRVRVPSDALAVLRYSDNTLIELRSDSAIRLVELRGEGEEPTAKALLLEQGALFAEVQPQRHSMVILTPNARARVLGTRFLLTATAVETRLDVQRGKVQFAPLPSRQGVDVVGGHRAVATSTNAQPAVEVTRAAASNRNLVQNPGFEEGLKNGRPEHWGGQRQITLDRTVAHSGTASLRVAGPAAFTYLWQSIALEPDTRYRLSVWIKTENVTGKDGVRARYAQIEPVTVVWRSAPIRGTSDWVQWSTEFQTPPDYCCGRLDVTWELHDGETAWFDDVDLVKIEPTTDGKR